MGAHKGRPPLALYLVALLIPIVLHIVAFTVMGDASYDKWLQNMHRSSSSPDVQPWDYNSKKEYSYYHRKKEGRRTQEGNSNGTAPSSSPSVIVVAQDGSGDFLTVQEAVDSIPDSNENRVTISIKAGIYREKIVVKTSWITFQGDGPSLTEIRWNDTASTEGPDGEALSTFGSASVAIDGDYFTARDISFRNTAPPPPGGAEGQQAVALRISGDFGAFYNVYFYGAQDTLYDHQGRHYFSGCMIEGSIDFIFGNGRSFYIDCRLHSIANPTGGSITAQKRSDTSEDTGFSFVECVVTGSGSIYLGRAWGPASRVVYSFTYFDDIIRPEGWYDWGDSSRQETVFYAEYNCTGPGANRDGRVSWSRELTAQEAEPFLTTGFINGELWLAST
ncbi:hypothetical protein KP509_03G061600 [Ceratopteris richardii]|uniref:Pectinesterase n=1 Tax=Ceratopteris richardii TaxID=49495 RepID=A0A8T2VC13_CERRI|nr:hypothetical protein KP509_03G061600 [Ceratopteris richardii]